MFRPFRRSALLCALFAALGATVRGQGSEAAVRFHGTGANQQDRLRIRLDDDAPGPDASTPADVGTASFTLELWVRGTLADNPSRASASEGSFADDRWRQGHALLDRDILSGTSRTFGVSLAGGRVRFGTGAGDGVTPDVPNTLEGDRLVLDGAWHHVAVARDAQTGRKLIYVDGALDIAGPTGVSRADLSYPDEGVPAPASPWGPFLVVGAAKEDVGPGQPSFRGRVDEMRIWRIARRGSEIASDMGRVVPAGTQNMVASYRFEEGAGTAVADVSGAGSPTGLLIAGVPGNGEWSLAAADPANVAPIATPSLPPGFARQEIVGGLSEPTSMAFTPDGRIFVAHRQGRISVFENGVMLSTPLLMVPIDNQEGERGLVGLVPDPDFAANGWIYVYATSPEPRNRVLRFTVSGNVADPASEFLVWQNPALAAPFHHGGGLCFGADGRLYIGTGDQSNGSNAPLLGNEHGKILRLSRDGTIPPDNPFLLVPGARPAIWARGVRNPFRLVLDPADGSLWVGDVGGNALTAWEELDRVSGGANLGWPDQEGPTCYAADCSAITFPTWNYPHDDPAFSPVPGSGCIIAGAFYRATQFPPEYRGNLFVGDYANRWVRRVVFDDSGQVTAAPVFDPAPGAGPIVDLDVGPDGALYTLAFGGSWSSNPESARITRISWTGGNQPPIANASAAPLQGPAPLVVQFHGSGSIDPDQGPGPLQFAWDFGDGATSNAADPQHVYTAQGQYVARLSVHDGSDATISAPITIRSGTPPDVRLALPAPGTSYRAGDVIVFSGFANDAEDGILPPAALTWQVELVHLAHTHPFLGPLPGVASGTFAIPTSGHEPADTHYRVRLTATDSSLLQSVREVELLPSVCPVRFTTLPKGIPLTVDGAPQPTPYDFDGLAGFQHLLTAPASRLVHGELYDFAHWSSRALTQTTRWTTPLEGGVLSAKYTLIPATTTTVAVRAAARNAQHEVVGGQQPHVAGDPNGIAFGRDAGGPLQAGFEFGLPVPRGARILSAHLSLRSAQDDGGVVAATVRAYATGDAPPFVFGSPTPLDLHAPLGAGSVNWSPPDWTGGAWFDSPDLAALVEATVARADWSSGNSLGLVVDGGPTRGSARRTARNLASGEPVRLVVRWAPPARSGLGQH